MIPCCDPTCKTIQILEPDPTLTPGLVTQDPALTESGDVILDVGQTLAQVAFVSLKASANYRFEYLYVDTLGISGPGSVEPVVTVQTQSGFTVEFAGKPVEAGYILRWRVTVTDSTLTAPEVDAPENIRV